MTGRSFELNVWDESQDPVIGNAIAVDTETELIKDQSFPPIVLLQVTAGNRVDLVPWQLADEYMQRLLRYNPHSTYFFVNAAFDMGVLGMKELYDLVDKRRIVDLMDRYKLWEISERGFVRKPASLANMTRNVLNEILPKDEDVRLTFKRDKVPSKDQLVYGAKDVIATWLLGLLMPPMPTEADSQVMGSIVLDAIARNGMLVDRAHFDKVRAEFSEKLEADKEYLEMHGYNPLLGKPSTEVLREGLEALGIEDFPGSLSEPKLEYMLYQSVMHINAPLDSFREKIRRAIEDIDKESCALLSIPDCVDAYVEMVQEGFDDKLKRDRVPKALELAKSVPITEIFAKTAGIRINPFKNKPRKRLNELTRDSLRSLFQFDTGLAEPKTVRGLGLDEMAEDKQLCRWPMASVLRELFKAKAGKLRAIPEFSFDTFVGHIQAKSIWYGGYSTQWTECMKPEKFLQARLLGIEKNNPEITFPRTKGGKNGKNKKIQASSKDKWIFKKFGIKDVLVETYISYKHNEKIVSTYMNPEHIHADGRVHTRYENYVRTGRTSAARPNVQNVPGDGGIRQMYVPKPMHLYASIDYSQLELCSLAQHTYKVFGHSRMRELINARIDLHSWFAAKTSGVLSDEDDYDGTEESRERVIAIIAKVETKVRKNAKAANFGFPGGMSAKTFLRTQRGYGNIEITLEECEELRNNWFLAFPEMAEHMKPEPDIVTDYDRRRFDDQNIRLHKAFNVAGVTRRKCTFNSACNYPFQSLAAIGAKRAMWAVWRDGRYAKYMVNFIHDELLFELPAETAADDVIEIQKIMVDAMKEVIPDVQIAAEGCLMECWDKDAEPVFDDFGNLTVWRPEEEEEDAA